jgi:hypothetical protein
VPVLYQDMDFRPGIFTLYIWVNVFILMDIADYLFIIKFILKDTSGAGKVTRMVSLVEQEQLHEWCH